MQFTKVYVELLNKELHPLSEHAGESVAKPNPAALPYRVLRLTDDAILHVSIKVWWEFDFPDEADRGSEYILSCAPSELISACDMLGYHLAKPEVYLQKQPVPPNSMVLNQIPSWKISRVSDHALLYKKPVEGATFDQSVSGAVPYSFRALDLRQAEKHVEELGMTLVRVAMIMEP